MKIQNDEAEQILFSHLTFHLFTFFSMRFLKLILISILVLFVVTTFVFALFPSDIRISRVLNIHSSKEKIAGVIVNLNTWTDWNEFFNDSSSGKSFSTPDFGKGAYIQSGSLRAAILNDSRDSIKTSWTPKNKQPFNGGFNIIQADRENMIVEWYFDFHFRWYPWEKLGSMYYDKQLGPLMEKSLINLKSYIENH